LEKFSFLNLANVCSSFDAAPVVPPQLSARTLSSPSQKSGRRRRASTMSANGSTGEGQPALDFLFAIEQHDDQRAVSQLHAPRHGQHSAQTQGMHEFCLRINLGARNGSRAVNTGARASRAAGLHPKPDHAAAGGRDCLQMKNREIALLRSRGSLHGQSSLCAGSIEPRLLNEPRCSSIAAGVLVANAELLSLG